MQNSNAGDLIIRLLAVASSLPKAQSHASTEIQQVATALSDAISKERHTASSASGQVQSLKRRLDSATAELSSIKAASKSVRPTGGQAVTGFSIPPVHGLPSAAGGSATRDYSAEVHHNTSTRPAFGTAPVMSQTQVFRPGVEFGRLTPPPPPAVEPSGKKRGPPALKYSDESAKRARSQGGQQPICQGCKNEGRRCNHEAQCSSCKTKNIRCVYVGCEKLFCGEIGCNRLHSYQWSKEDRPRWNVVSVERDRPRSLADEHGDRSLWSMYDPYSDSSLSMPPPRDLSTTAVAGITSSTTGQQAVHEGRRSPPVHPDRLVMQSHAETLYEPSPSIPAVHHDRLAMQLYDPSHPPYEATGGGDRTQMQAEHGTRVPIKLEEGELLEDLCNESRY